MDLEPRERTALLDATADVYGLASVEEFARRYVLAELVWPGGAMPFLNVNTPAELSVAAHRLDQSRLGPVRPRSRR